MTFLNQPLSELAVSTEFVKRAEILGLHSLEDVMSVDINQLKQETSFSYQWYADLLNLLKEIELLDEFQDRLL
jgi:hypothetical protein